MIIRKIALMILLAGVVLVGLGSGCPFKGEDGDDGMSGSSGATGQDALISFNSYKFTASFNPSAVSIPEISFTGVEAGWQLVTGYIYTSGMWLELPMSVGDGTTTETDYGIAVRAGGVTIEVMEDGVTNQPPLRGYDYYMVIVQTFAH